VAKSPNYIKAAFLMPANLVGLGTAAASAAMTGEPLPALVALGLEGLYLGVVSSMKRFQRAVRAKTPDDPEAARKAVDALQSDLAPSQREHYQQLLGLKEKILANYRKLPGGKVLEADSEPRLDALLTSFLRLISTLNQYRAYLNSSDREHLEREVRELEEDVAREANPRLKDVKQNRVDILRKRLARFQQAGESREVVSHQLAGIEDLMRLTHEQSIAIRDPESVNRQLTVLSAEAEATEESVRQMEQFLEFSEETRGPLPHGTRVR
jgi:endo-alpha-1,4-polygalactosaminidase (GH114 family)